jgi:hypothetical protein
MADGLDLRNARILLCNDDGIHAQGIAVLERIARSIADDVWIVAPETEQSAASHSLTIHRPLRLREMARQRFAVDGTPTDCALLAVKHVLKGALPTLVLSGVNHGSNLAQDIGYSGTVAAAIEATIALHARIGKTPVHVKRDVAGFVGLHIAASPELAFTVDGWFGKIRFENGPFSGPAQTTRRETVQNIRLGLVFRY